MQRDMDLIRKILFKVEEAQTFTDPIRVKIEDYSQDAIYYHVKLLKQAGYIEAVCFGTGDNPNWYPLSLTWQGHEFLDAARDDMRWNKAKSIILEMGRGVVFDVLKQVLVSLMTQSVTGIQAGLGH